MSLLKRKKKAAPAPKVEPRPKVEKKCTLTVKFPKDHGFLYESEYHAPGIKARYSLAGDHRGFLTLAELILLRDLISEFIDAANRKEWGLL